MDERHPMIAHYERIMENYDSDRVAAKLRGFLALVEWQARVDYAAELRAVRRPWWTRLLDRLAFVLMDVVALLSIYTWARERTDRRLVKCTPSIKRWDYCHDGWRPSRYV